MLGGPPYTSEGKWIRQVAEMPRCPRCGIPRGTIESDTCSCRADGWMLSGVCLFVAGLIVVGLSLLTAVGVVQW